MYTMPGGAEYAGCSSTAGGVGRTEREGVGVMLAVTLDVAVIVAVMDSVGCEGGMERGR